MLDRRIVDFALSLPTTWHIRDARKRRIFRDAMQGILPEKIRWRFDKLTPFPTAAGNELRQTPERLRIAERLAEHPMVQQIFNMKTVRAGVESVRTSKDEDSPVFVNAYVALGFAQYIEEHFPANFQESSAPITERDTLFP
jgi:asparagine synthase (glutamine-hydrolysing)